MASDKELFKDRIEVSLDGRQIFYLFFGGAVIATLVFVLGVMVGRQVESRTVAETGSTVRDPLAALDQLESGNELAFPAALRGDEVSLGMVDDKLAQREVLARVSAPLVAAKMAASAAESEKPNNASQKGLDKADKEPAPPKEGKRRFTLQVGSFQDKTEADTFFRQLETTTYQPYMVEAEIPGKGQYYRVRVGGYQTFDEALSAKSTFEDSQHVIAYVTRIK